jgi:hypothetical protein
MSAAPDNAQPTEMLHKNHIEMVKFSSTEDSDYRQVVLWIQDIFGRCTKVVPGSAPESAVTNGGPHINPAVLRVLMPVFLVTSTAVVSTLYVPYLLPAFLWWPFADTLSPVQATVRSQTTAATSSFTRTRV